MDISNIKYHTTADLLSELILSKMMDTAIGGAIAKELLQRGIDAHDVYVAVRELLAIYAARADGTDEPEFNDDLEIEREDDDV